jgi:hypothetical protein
MPSDRLVVAVQNSNELVRLFQLDGPYFKHTHPASMERYQGTNLAIRSYNA